MSLVTKIILLNVLAISAMGILNAYRIYSKGTVIVYDLRKKSIQSITHEKVARTVSVFDEARNLVTILAKADLVKNRLKDPTKNKQELDRFIAQYKKQ